ncbi:MAG: hypothetical protein M2R45_04095 [Verrucomicrobia subdivision 3 bacterium]|nr:hypothetical protein [Limisphaerales bacterium]MCS1417104.1 hypothetical protein [Limisphaerales bacterium]
MAIVKLFRALRPKFGLAAQICELPYDVLSSEEARVAANGRPHSFFHVSKPEIDLPEGTAPYDAAAYAKGRENFDRLIDEGCLVQDPEAHYYLYRQVMGQHTQVGLVAVSSCEEYDCGVVKKHEFTRLDKENDRVKHMEALDAQTGPVFLTYRADAELDALFAKVACGDPKVDFTSDDEVRHTAWVISDSELARFIEAKFSSIPYLYIADGHHRSAAASRVAKARGGKAHSDHFLTVLFPHDQMQILAYNRFVHDLNNATAEQFLEKIQGVLSVSEAPAAVEPTLKHQLGMYLAGRWYALEFRPEALNSKSPIELLDVSLLQRHVFTPLLGIQDPRRSRRISFVGGIRGTGELEKLVDAAGTGVAFSMFPTSIEDLMAVADQDGIMPPKSTWFEPKLRDAMFCHMLR